MTHHTNRYYKDLERFPTRRRKLPWGLAITESFHHFHYDHIKHRYSIYWLDGIYLPQWLHVPIVHRILGGGDRAGNQAFGKFPNVAQRGAHWIFRLLALPLLPFDAMAPLWARAMATIVLGALGRLAWEAGAVPAVRALAIVLLNSL